MNNQLSNFLKTFNQAEKTAYFSHIKNKFKNKIKFSKNINFKNVQFTSQLENIYEIFGANFLINTIFKNTNNFKFANENNVKIKKHKTAMGPVIVLEIKNSLEFDSFLEKVLKTSNSKANQGACLIFNNNFSLIVVSNKPYSGVHESLFNLNRTNWANISTKIRIEHEIAHFYMNQIYGNTANNLHDELVADFVAISKIMNNFKAQWFMKFISQPSKFGQCRFDILTQKLPVKTKQAVFLTAKICAKFAENWFNSKNYSNNSIDKIKFLCELGLEKMIENKNFNHASSPFSLI